MKRIDPDRFNEKFEATNGWLFKFIKRHNLSLRRKTSAAQKDPDLLIAKIVSYILRVRSEPPVWADMVSNTTVDVVGKKTVSMKTTGHKKMPCNRWDNSKS